MSALPRSKRKKHEWEFTVNAFTAMGKQARETVTQVRFWIARHRARRLVDVMMVK
jgi:hypothetical protein